MALLIEAPEHSYNLEEIKAGYLVYAKHRTWEEGKAGIITTANEKQLIVQYYPGICNVTNHYILPVEEIHAGEWEIRWSADLSEVKEYTESPEGDKTESGSQELHGGEAKEETENTPPDSIGEDDKDNGEEAGYAAGRVNP